jgi:hypothetical protein
MKALYTFYENEKGFVIERQRFEEFVRTQPFVDIMVENRRLPINTWPEGIHSSERTELICRCESQTRWETRYSSILPHSCGSRSNYETFLSRTFRRRTRRIQ